MPILNLREGSQWFGLEWNWKRRIDRYEININRYFELGKLKL